MLRRRIHSIAVVAAIASLALTGTTGLAAAATSGSDGHARSTKVAPKHRSSAKRAPGGSRSPRPPAGPTAVAISAFPTGDKGSGSEATCGLWSDRLQADVEILDQAESLDDKLAASDDLHQDISDALDAGCAVIH